MRKKIIIKLCAIAVGVWIALMIGKGFYWYYRLDGENISMKISSQHSKTSADIEVYIDDELVFKDEKYLSFFQSVRVKYPFGIYELKVIIDKKEYIHRFILFPVKFIYIEISKDQVWSDKSREASVIIDISASPYQHDVILWQGEGHSILFLD